jgi:hypothetical protein
MPSRARQSRVSIAGATASFCAAFFTGAGLGLALGAVRFAALDTLRPLPRLAEFPLRSFARFCTFDAFLRLAMITPLVSLSASNHVRFWHKADISRLSSDVRFWGYPPPPPEPEVSTVYVGEDEGSPDLGSRDFDPKAWMKKPRSWR